MEKWSKPIRKPTNGFGTPSSKWQPPVGQTGGACGSFLTISTGKNKSSMASTCTRWVGQKVPLSELTGAGKTTITDLINRFYDIQSGMITYDGIDIKLIEKRLRRPRNRSSRYPLFTGTIGENIAYGRAGCNTGRNPWSSSDCQCGFLCWSTLIRGYETVLTDDGAGLSNGQRQLIAIARSPANAPVLTRAKRRPIDSRWSGARKRTKTRCA